MLGRFLPGKGIAPPLPKSTVKLSLKKFSIRRRKRRAPYVAVKLHEIRPREVEAVKEK